MGRVGAWARIRVPSEADGGRDMMQDTLSILLVGIIAVLGLSLANELYDLNLLFYRTCRCTALADTWQRRKRWWLPCTRVVLATAAVASLLLLHAR